MVPMPVCEGSRDCLSKVRCVQGGRRATEAGAANTEGGLWQGVPEELCSSCC